MQSLLRSCQPCAPSSSGRGLQQAVSPLLRGRATCAAPAASSRVVCHAVKEQQQARTPQGIDPAYTNGAAYLKIVGFVNPAEIARVLDIAMNPNSLFVDYGGNRARNASARPLDVEKDIKPVVDFLDSKGVSGGDVLKIISGHPPVLSYSTDRLSAFWDYLASIGVPDVNAAIVTRPSLLGIEVEKVKTIVEYLQYTETPPEKIVQYLTTSI